MARTANANKQNWLTYSEQFDNAAWTKQANVVVTANQAVAPDGTTTADLIDVTAAAGSTGVFQVASNSAMGFQNTKSVWLKGVLGTEVVTLCDPSTSVGVTTCTLTTSWQRFTLTEAAGTQAGNAGLWIRKSSGNQFYAWGAQLVRANWAGNYAVTTASQVGTTTPIRNIVPQLQNLVFPSENLSLSNWQGSNMTFAASANPDPIGGTAAFTLTPTGANSRCVDLIAISQLKAGMTATISCWARTAAGGTTTCAFRDSNVGPIGSNLTITGTWQRFSATWVVPISAPIIALFQDMSGTQTVLEVWGAQIVIGNWAGTYVKTTTAVVDTGNIRNIVPVQQNLLLRSEALATSPWAKGTGSINVANDTADTTAPDGTSTASKLSTTAGGLDTYVMYQYPITGFNLVDTYTLSFYAKQGTFSKILGSLNNGVTKQALFNLSAGTVTSNSGVTGKITSIGDGWYRCSVTGLGTVSGGLVELGFSSSVSSRTFTPAGTETLYVWGVQLTKTNWMSPYVQTVASAVNAGGIRSIVPQLQNILLNSGDMTASGWSTSGAITSIAMTSAVLDPVDGVSQVNLLDLTASAAGNGRFQTTTTTGPGAKTVSAYMRTVSGTGNINFGVANVGDAPVALTETWQRVSYTVTTALPAPGIFFRKSASSPALQVYIARPQFVNGSWAGPTTSPTGATALNTGDIRQLA